MGMTEREAAEYRARSESAADLRDSEAQQRAWEARDRERNRAGRTSSGSSSGYQATTNNALGVVGLVAGAVIGGIVDTSPEGDPGIAGMILGAAGGGFVGLLLLELLKWAVAIGIIVVIIALIRAGIE